MPSERTLCSRCGGPPGVFPVPVKRCPSCSAEVDVPAQEGTIHCSKCGHEFGDYEEWVRLCRAAAFAAIRPVAPPPEEPPPRPPHLKPIAVGLLAMAAFYVTAGLLVGRLAVMIPCIALALLQALAALALLQEWRHADGLVRFAAGVSALLPLFVAPLIFFVGLFAFFSRPMVAKYFGGRVDPLAERLRHPMIAWLFVSLGVFAALFAAILAPALETAQRWNDTLTPLMALGAGVSDFILENWWWAPAGLLGGLCILALWGKVNRHGFLGVAVLAIIGVVSIGAPPVVEAWLYEKSAKEAESYRDERDVKRLLWGAREDEPDPKIRLSSLRAMSAVGRNAKVLVPALQRSIKDPDRRVRLEAAVALAQFDPSVEGVLAILIGALEDDRSNAEEKDRASLALGYYGPRARPALSFLLERLKHGDAPMLALVEMGPASIPGLTEGLMDRDARVRRRAARALRLQGPAARSAVPLLIDRLKDEDLSVRTEAAIALGEIHREKAIPILQDLLRQDKAAAKAAAEALCALGQRDGLSELPQGSSAMNALRQPAIWDHLGKSVLDKDVEGSGAEVLVDLSERAVMCADIGQEVADLPALTSFRRIFAAARKRSVLEVLNSLDVNFVLESDRIVILTPDQAKAFWAEWLAELRKKRE